MNLKTYNEMSAEQQVAYSMGYYDGQRVAKELAKERDMITASELGRLEGKRAVQISFDGETIEIVFEDVFDEYGNEVDRNLRISPKPTGDGLNLTIW